MKDPAFLFYSKDFYEGTRMMLPEERACYIDLLIYQHQHGYIPNDIKRMSLYCSGIDEATLKATLEAKFKHTEKGWINERLNNEVLGREKFKITQSENGKVGQFWKKAKNILKQKEFSQLYKELKDKDLILNFINENDITIVTLKGLLKHCLSNKGNGSVDVNEDEIKEEDLNLQKSEILEIDRAFNDFKKMRKEIKKPLSERAEQMIKTKLKTLSGDDMDLAVNILDQSTLHCWQDIYEVKTENKFKPGGGKYEDQSEKIRNAGMEAIKDLYNN